MKLKKINFLSIIILLFGACSDLDTIISKQVDDWNLDYNINLTRTDSGENKSFATIQWNGYTDYNDFKNYTISYNDVIIEESDSSVTSYRIDLSPGEITKITFEVYNDLDNIISDEIQVYTRKVYPITDLNFSVDGTYKHFLSWEGSLENDFNQHKIFRSINPSLELPFINPEECTEDNNCINIATINDNSIIEFTDSTTTGLGYSYLITTFDVDGLYTNSTLKTGYTEYAEAITNISASNNFTEKIEISWDPIIAPEEMYSIEIWRGASSNVNDSNNHTKIVTIFDPTIIYYEDRNDIGSATSWYYMIKLTNIFGRYSKSSDEIHGITQP